MSGRQFWLNDSIVNGHPLVGALPKLAGHRHVLVANWMKAFAVSKPAYIDAERKLTAPLRLTSETITRISFAMRFEY